VHKIATLAHDSARIFLIRRWHIHDTTHAFVTCEIGFEDTDHGFGVDAVSLHALAAARYKEAGRIKNVSIDAICPQQSCQPEAIIADLEA